MQTLLVVGIESVVGANLTVSLSAQSRVCGVSLGPALDLPDCERLTLTANSVESIGVGLQQTQASRVMFCGPEARSSWESCGASSQESLAEMWASAAAQAGIHFTLISSDAIFAGPWMFHAEDSASLCGSAEAQAIRAIEERVIAVCPKSLIVRTNAFGWSPLGDAGWIESILNTLAAGRSIESDPIRHATPILATDLADYLGAALEDELTGVFHIAGAERISQHQFVRRVASAFGCPAPTRSSLRELSERPLGFGRSETSLKTTRFRREYECSMPLLSEGIERLVEQQRSGYRDRLCGQIVRSGKAA